MRHEFVNTDQRIIDAINPNVVASPIEVSLDTAIASVEVTVDITHSFTSDLVISLIGPTGQRVLLVGREGGNGDNFEGTTFSENATLSIIEGRAPFRGAFRPEGDLELFEGKPAKGTWLLQVADRAFADGGQLNGWRLAINTVEAAPQFGIGVRFLGGLSPSQQQVFEVAAERWSEIIVADLPAVNTDIGVVDDLVIDAEGSAIDGRGGTLGQAGPTALRPGSKLPARGIMSFDSADLARMEADNSLFNVIVHEMGHVLGLGTLWPMLGLIRGSGTDNPLLVGDNVMREYAQLIGADGPTPVPIANTGGRGTREGHWRETTFGNELMTGFLNTGQNPLSRLTVAALQDLGYSVTYTAADAFNLPSTSMLLSLGIRDGLLERQLDCTMMRCPDHFVLPDEAVV